MNCEDISRIADTGSFNRLGDAERRAAEAHALTCRRCAAVWAAHSRLATLRIPPMPAELSMRCRTLAAQAGRGRQGLKWLPIASGLVAVSAAAWMLGQVLSTPAPEAPPEVAMPVPASDPVPESLPEAAAPTVVAVPEPDPAPPVVAQAEAALPLLLPPSTPSAARTAAIGQSGQDALQKAVERHPELVEGPLIDDWYVVGLVMQSDGKAIDSMARLSLRGQQGDANMEVNRMLPKDGVSGLDSLRTRGTLVADGRALRATVNLKFVVLPAGYDMARSNLRIEPLVRAKYADQMLPMGGGVNLLTLLMSDDGSIAREKMERPPPEELGRLLQPGSPDDVARLAEAIAMRLDLGIDEIGMIGSALVEDGTLSPVVDTQGRDDPDERRRVLLVNYAWPRRNGEPAPFFGQGNPQGSALDYAAALTLVEKFIPDAFIDTSADAGRPMLVLSAKGEVMAAGRVQIGRGNTSGNLAQQLVPGVRTNASVSPRLRGSNGTSAEVLFVWEAAEQAQRP